MADALVEVRTPCYKRPEMLKAAMASLQAQTWPHWRCKIYDDSGDDSCKSVVDALGDPRITHEHNAPRRFAAGNIDRCFARLTDADYAFVLEDDNLVLPTFMADNIAACREHAVRIVLRNQYITPPGVDLSDLGDRRTVLDRRFHERVYQPLELQAAALFSIGVSNGGLFWSREADTDFEVRAPGGGPVLHEYFRTMLVRDPVFVALQPLACWTEDEISTTRYSGAKKRDFWRQEMMMKKTLGRERRRLMRDLRQAGLGDLPASDLYKSDPATRQREMVKALIGWRWSNGIGLRERSKLMARGVMIELTGALPKDYTADLAARLAN